MPEDGYAYGIDQCDVPRERRNALQRYRDRRRLWLTWLHTDEHHAIWPTLHSMVWTEVAFGTLTALAVDSGENALNNPLLAEALVTGHVATQVLAIRRLMEDGPKERLSLRSLIKDLNRNAALFTRENYVCYDGSPYDYAAVREARFIDDAEKRAQRGVWVPRGGPQDDTLSENLHTIFDKLAGIQPARRSREDRLPRELLSAIEKWLDESGADELAKWASTYLAHAGGPNERTWLGDVTVTTSKITDAIRALARVTQAISLFVYGGGRAGAVMPSAPFDQFQRLDRSIMREDDDEAARDFWGRLSAEWDRCVDGVEDELAKPRLTRSSPP
jgi:hypothetical protein